MALICNIGEKQAWPKPERDHNEEVNETWEEGEERERVSEWAGSGVQTEGGEGSNR
jgi:hypothetical protein